MGSALLRYSIRMAVLTIGVAFVTYGAVAWHYQDFATHGAWLYDNGWKPHPMHFLVIGIGTIPLALRDIFVLEQGRTAQRQATPPAPPAGAAATAADGGVAAEVESA